MHRKISVNEILYRFSVNLRFIANLIKVSTKLILKFNFWFEYIFSNLVIFYELKSSFHDTFHAMAIVLSAQQIIERVKMFLWSIKMEQHIQWSLT